MALAAIFLLPLVAEGQYIRQEDWLPTTYNYLVQFLYPAQLFQLDWGFGHALIGPDDGMSFQLGLWLLILGLGGVRSSVGGYPIAACCSPFCWPPPPVYWQSCRSASLCGMPSPWPR